MRRQEAVRDGERCGHWDADFEERHASGGCDREDERDQQDEADFIEERDADDEAREADRPFDVFLAKDVDECRGDAMGGAAIFEQLDEHGIE